MSKKFKTNTRSLRCYVLVNIEMLWFYYVYKNKKDALDVVHKKGICY